jgi:hypothetical protein
MSNVLSEARAVVDALDGVPAVAGLCSVTEPAVWNWISANRFPSRTYFAMRDRLKVRRKKADESLWYPAERKPTAPSEQTGAAA